MSHTWIQTRILEVNIYLMDHLRNNNQMTVGFPKVLSMCTFFWHSLFDPKPQSSTIQQTLFSIDCTELYSYYLNQVLQISSCVCGNTLRVLLNGSHMWGKKGFLLLPSFNSYNKNEFNKGSETICLPARLCMRKKITSLCSIVCSIL